MPDVSLFAKNALPIKDHEVINYLNKINKQTNIEKILTSLNLKDLFLDNYFNWLQKSKRVQYKGIEKFIHKSFSHGTIQCFDFFYSKFSSKRFRFFKGEFLYHKLSCRNNYSYKFIEDDILRYGDAVLLSLPFSDSGNKHPRTDEILKTCDDLKIPLLLDLAYINICGNLEVNLNHPCIETISFSLSKTFFSLDRLRVGMRLKKEYDDDPMDVFNSINMINNFGVHIGNELISHFKTDYNYNKYSKKQKLLCDEYGLNTSNCLIFGLGGEIYKDFNRGGEFNRVCLSNLLGDG